jgi:hypothetical protein
VAALQLRRQSSHAMLCCFHPASPRTCKVHGFIRHNKSVVGVVKIMCVGQQKASNRSKQCCCSCMLICWNTRHREQPA